MKSVCCILQNSRGMHHLNATSTFLSLDDLVREHSIQLSHREAILCPDRSPLLYHDLFQNIDQIRRALQNFGIQREDRVAIVLPNGPDMAITFLAVACTAICAPLNPGYRAAEFEFYLADLSARALLVGSDTDSASVEVARRLNIPVGFLSNSTGSNIQLDFGESPAKQANDRTASPDDIALVLHTSGTTARPKIVPLSHRNLLASAGNIARWLKLTPEDRCLNLMPLFHIHGLMGGLLSSVFAGSSVVCPPGFFAPQFFEWMDEFQPSWYTAVPTMHQAILTRAAQTRRPIPGKLRFIRSSSASLPVPVLQQLEQTFAVPVIEAYGMTEASHQMASNPLDGKRKPGSVGLATGIQIAIMDEQGSILPQGQIGEVVIRGDSITSGYETTHQKDVNQKAFVDGWFRTGDLGCLDQDGYLFLKGRIKEVINRAGEKISPQEVDQVLLEHPAVLQAVTFALPDAKLGEAVAAAVILRSEITELELREFASTRLADFKVPAKIVFVKEIPKGPTGKLQRIGLAGKLGLLNPPDNPASSSPPSGAGAVAVDQIKQLWEKVLRIQGINENEDFFALGGDSILATQLLNQVGRDFGVNIPLVRLFQSPTVSGMARVIQESLTSEAPQLPRIAPNPSENFLPFPLTDIQQAYWVGRSGAFELGNVSTHLYIELEAHNPDVRRLEKAWRKVIDRHGMLRAVFRDGRQQILESVEPYRIEVHDFTPQESQEERDRLRQRMSQQVFPSDRWPLFEICVTTVEGENHRIHLSFDALIMDAWSRRIVFREWQQFYEDTDSVLPPLELSFRDFVLTEQRLSSSKLYQDSWNYWKQRAALLPPAPQLPLAPEDKKGEAPQFLRKTFRLDSAAWTRLKKQAATLRVTPSTLLLSAYGWVLRNWSKNPQFTINLTFFNRLPLHPQINEIVGDFTSLVLVGVEIEAGSTFKRLSEKIQEQLWGDLDHRYVSGIQVMREIRKGSRELPRAMMPVVFTSFFAQEQQGLHPLRWLGTELQSSSQTPQVWLDLQVDEINGRLVCHWNQLEKLFPPGMMEDMFDAFCGFVNDLAKEDHDWEAPLKSLIPASQIAQREQVNATTAHRSPELLHTLFVKQARRTPNASAVISAGKSLTYSELYRLSNTIALELKAKGAQPNTLIGIVMEKGWEEVVATLAILLSGAAYVPISPELPAERLQWLLQTTGVKVALTQTRVDSSVPWPRDVARICVDQVTPGDGPLLDIGEQGPNDLAYVIFTSGSTGQPKGVMIEHAGAVNTILDMNHRFAVTPEDKVLAVSSLYFDLSVYDIFGMLAAGGTVVIPEAASAQNPARWSEWIRKERITIWNTVPALMGVLVDYTEHYPEWKLDSLRLVLLSGDWIPTQLPQSIRGITRNSRVVSLGGATEASIWSILYPIEKSETFSDSVPYGRPMENQTFHVLHENFQPCPVWVPGSLYIGGAGLARGYWADEQKTRESFVRHPDTGERLYRTGDMGRYLPDGNIQFLGREDTQIKIQGYRVELNEIVTILSKHPNVSSAFVKAFGDRMGPKRLVAYTVNRTQMDPEALRKYLSGQLPSYMVPTAFVSMDAFPLTPNGKIDLRAFAEPAKHQSANIVDIFPKPAGRIQQAVRSVMNHSDIHESTNLLEAGATSVDMIRILNLLEKEFGFRLGMKQFYENPTISALADLYGEGSVQLDSPESMVPILSDPLEREAFKKKRLGIRRDEGRSADLPPLDPETWQKFESRRSHREFSLKPVRLEELSKFLGALKQKTSDEEVRHYYGSAGGLYPVQLYVYAKPGRIHGLLGGCYYYHPEEHRLLALTESVELGRNIYQADYNKKVFDEAAFALFLVANMSAIVPMYGEDSVRFVTIEAGLITQLMEVVAPECNLGLCQIGRIDFERIRPLFKLSPDHRFLHSLVGGPPESRKDSPDDQAARLRERIQQLSEEEVRALLEANRRNKKK